MENTSRTNSLIESERYHLFFFLPSFSEVYRQKSQRKQTAVPAQTASRGAVCSGSTLCVILAACFYGCDGCNDQHTAMVIWIQDLGLKSHPKELREAWDQTHIKPMV